MVRNHNFGGNGIMMKATHTLFEATKTVLMISFPRWMEGVWL